MQPLQIPWETNISCPYISQTNFGDSYHMVLSPIHMVVETLEGSQKGKRNMEELNLSGKKTPCEHALVNEEIVEVKQIHI